LSASNKLAIVEEFLYMANLKAGIGDPYWYEWSVGLLYSLDMLNPDNDIRHVILQESHLQGLDDVVVVYNDNHVYVFWHSCAGRIVNLARSADGKNDRARLCEA
jgi:hypothetical protein